MENEEYNEKEEYNVELEIPDEKTRKVLSEEGLTFILIWAVLTYGLLFFHIIGEYITLNIMPQMITSVAFCAIFRKNKLFSNIRFCIVMSAVCFALLHIFFFILWFISSNNPNNPHTR